MSKRATTQNATAISQVSKNDWQDLHSNDESDNQYPTDIPSQVILHRLTAAIKGTAANLVEDIEIVVVSGFVHRVSVLSNPQYK